VTDYLHCVVTSRLERSDLNGVADVTCRARQPAPLEELIHGYWIQTPLPASGAESEATA
jgi:hypothetical protein